MIDAETLHVESKIDPGLVDFLKEHFGIGERESTKVTIQIGIELLADVDSLAKHLEISRSAMVSCLLNEGRDSCFRRYLNQRSDNA